MGTGPNYITKLNEDNPDDLMLWRAQRRGSGGGSCGVPARRGRDICGGGGTKCFPGTAGPQAAAQARLWECARRRCRTRASTPQNAPLCVRTGSPRLLAGRCAVGSRQRPRTSPRRRAILDPAIQARPTRAPQQGMTGRRGPVSPLAPPLRLPAPSFDRPLFPAVSDTFDPRFRPSPRGRVRGHGVI